MWSVQVEVTEGRESWHLPDFHLLLHGGEKISSGERYVKARNAASCSLNYISPSSIGKKNTLTLLSSSCTGCATHLLGFIARAWLVIRSARPLIPNSHQFVRDAFVAKRFDHPLARCGACTDFQCLKTPAEGAACKQPRLIGVFCFVLLTQEGPSSHNHQILLWCPRSST